MTAQRAQLLSRLATLRADTAAAAAELAATHQPEIESYRKAISDGVSAALSRLRRDVEEISDGNRACLHLVSRASEYVDWLQWTFWDLPHFAFALEIPRDRFQTAVTSCGMVYLSMRIFDDVIDRHYRYKGRHATLLSLLEAGRAGNQTVDGLAILAGLLICFEGLGRLADSQEPGSPAMLRKVAHSIRRAVIGAIMELSPPQEWSAGYYQRLIYLKNVDFWKTLFASVDPTGASPIGSFLERYYALAQKLNDVQDYAEDTLRGQPNFLALHLSSSDTAVSGAGHAAPENAETALALEFLELAGLAAALPPRESLVARCKLGESLAEACRLGLFAEPAEENLPHSEAALQPPLGLQWYSRIDEVISRSGAGALVVAACEVCGSAERKYLFDKQGFSFHRCVECSHVYVSPRIRPDLSARLAAELDTEDNESRLLEVQKYYAAPICHLLRSRAPGCRLLDIGFGRGYLVQLAKSYGFEVYGIDSSASQVERLQPQFGRRLIQANIGDADLPWGSFDVIVVSHVLEHLERPSAFLRKAFEAMNPEGILYLAVPDIQSVQFQVFGKKWEVISPLAHFQYFNEASLSRLVTSCGFTDLERVQHAPVPAEIAPRWMRLMRRLGATDAGELAMLAARPPEP